MKKNQYLLLLISLFPCFVLAQNTDIACKKITKIHEIIIKHHYKPKAVNDSLSVAIYENFLNTLDEDKFYFTSVEATKLSKHKLLIDNYILDKNFAFLDEFFITYKNALKRQLTLIKAIESEPFSFNTKDTIFFTRKNKSYIKDEKVQKRILKKRITHDILIDISKQSKNIDSIQQNFAKISQTSKSKIFDNYKCKINSIISNEDDLKSDFYNSFYNAFSSVFDPHTSYLNITNKSNFLASVSANNSTTGLNLEMDDNDNLVVASVIPGSPAYKTEKIDSGDQLLKIKHLSNEHVISCSNINKIEELLSSDTYKTLTVTLRKKNGVLIDVELTKESMKMDNNLCYSFVVGNQNKMGYIKIPSFYGDEQGTNYLSNDVANEIIKLKNDKVNGIIIDLEYNGGGNTFEAVKLVGMFIDLGPVAIINNNNNVSETLKDFNRGFSYDGPLVIMINGFSASASEFFANAMQDYNRAIIIGNSSFGKATAQSIIPLEDNETNEDFLKITEQKFYRITGKSHQKNGLTPDIELPMLFDSFIPRESSKNYALEADEIVQKLHFKKFKSDFSDAIEKSKNRINTNSYFTSIDSINQIIKTNFNQDKKPLLLDFKSVFEDVHKLNDLYEEIAKILKTKFAFQIQSTSEDIEKIKFNSFLQNETNEKIKQLENNGRVEEAIKILEHLIN